MIGRSAPASNEAASAAAVEAPPLAPTAEVPLCYVVDEEPSIRHFLSLVLHGSGIDTMEFADGAALRRAAEQRAPDLVFHNISIEFGRRHRNRDHARQDRLSRRGPAHEQSRRGRARARQGRRRAAWPQHAAGAQEAVRDRRHRQDHPGAQARHAAAAGRPARPRRGARQQVDRVLVSAQDRPAQKAARRRRSLCARAPSAARRRAAGRLHAGRDANRA